MTQRAPFVVSTHVATDGVASASAALSNTPAGAVLDRMRAWGDRALFSESRAGRNVAAILQSSSRWSTTTTRPSLDAHASNPPDGAAARQVMGAPRCTKSSLTSGAGGGTDSRSSSDEHSRRGGRGTSLPLNESPSVAGRRCSGRFPMIAGS